MCCAANKKGTACQTVPNRRKEHSNKKQAAVFTTASGIYIVAGSAFRPGSESDNLLSAFRRYQFSTYKRPLSTAL